MQAEKHIGNSAGTTVEKEVTVRTFGRVSVAKMEASFSQSVDFAKARQGRLLTYNEVIAETSRNPQLSEHLRLEGRAAGSDLVYFWLHGKNGINLADHQRISTNYNVFVPTPEKEWLRLPFSERGFAWKGKGPLFIILYNTDILGIRMYLFGDNKPTLRVPFIVYRTMAKDGSAEKGNATSETNGTSGGGLTTTVKTTVETGPVQAVASDGPKLTERLMDFLRRMTP